MSDIAEKELFYPYFQDGWDDIENLKHLPEDEKDTYVKTFNFDCFEMCVTYFSKMNEFLTEDKGTWIPFLKSRVPRDDKEIDYFLMNNKEFLLIFICIHNSLKDYFKQKQEEHEAELQKIQDEVAQKVRDKLNWVEEHMGLLKEWKDPRHNQLARETISMVEPFLLKLKTKDQGSDPKRVERDSNIRSEYSEMETEGYDHSHIRKTLAKKYGLKPSTIKAIKYSIKDLM